MTGRLYRVAVEAGVATVLFAALLSLMSVLGYGTADAGELARLAFWTAALGAFALLAGFGSAPLLLRMDPLPGRLLVGFGVGLAFTAVARLPTGPTDAGLATPVLLVWPLACALAFAGAGPRGPRAGDGRIAWPFAVSGWTLAVAVLAAAKAPLPPLAAAVEMPGPPASAAVPVSDAPGGLPAGAPRVPPPLVPCVDSVAPRPPIDVLSEPGTLMAPLGDFADLRRVHAAEEPHVYGYQLALFHVEGVPLGTFALVAGPEGRAPMAGQLENGRLDGRTGELRFDVHFGDGFFARFEGRLEASAVVGVLTTRDAGCVGRTLGSDTLVLGRHPVHDNRTEPLYGYAPGALSSYFPWAWARRPASLWDAQQPLRRLVVPPERFWWGAGTTAMAYEAHIYETAVAAALVAEPGRPLAGAQPGAAGLRLRDIVYAVERRGDHEYRWIIVAPYRVASAYARAVEAEAATGALTLLRNDLVEVVPCCGGAAGR